MHCPICKHPTLEQISLEPELPAYQCPSCRGIFFLANEYLRWRLAQNAPSLPSEFQAVSATPTLEVEAAKICPNCGRLMMRYNVLPNGTLYLDRCAGCNSIWCDPRAFTAAKSSACWTNFTLTNSAQRITRKSKKSTRGFKTIHSVRCCWHICNRMTHTRFKERVAAPKKSVHVRTDFSFSGISTTRNSSPCPSPPPSRMRFPTAAPFSFVSRVK